MHFKVFCFKIWNQIDNQLKIASSNTSVKIYFDFRMKDNIIFVKKYHILYDFFKKNYENKTLIASIAIHKFYARIVISIDILSVAIFCLLNWFKYIIKCLL